MAHRSRRRRAGFTLAELLVVIAIIAALTALLLVSGAAVHKAIRRQRVETQIRLLGDAIERYTQKWPKWVDPATGTVLSDKGWPHWSSTWVFQPNPFGPFTLEPNFNQWPPRREIGDDDMEDLQVTRMDVEAEGECLAFQLTSKANGGPFLTESEGVFVRAHVDGLKLYPRRADLGETASVVRREVVDYFQNDSKTNFYRYLWVTRDPQTPSGWRAITSAMPADANQLDPSTGWNRFAKAEGFVLESAGPDGKFGNIWRRMAAPFEQEPDYLNAQDNIMIRP